jgi:hypothetical protein
VRTRTPLLAAALLAAVVGLGIVVFDDDEPDQVATDVETTTTTSTSESTSTSTTATTTSTTTTATTATTVPATTSPPVTAPSTSPPATSPPATTPPPPPPPPPPPSNPRIATVTAAQLGASWRSGCPVGPQDLRRITVTHRGFDGRDHTGHLVVHEDWADELLGVFDAIHAAGFAIQRIQPVDAFGASDDASMAANNTSAFNCRAVTGGTGWSRHSFGRAIDVNPIQNPYVIDRSGTDTILPPAGGPYAFDRSRRQGVITAGDAVVSAFSGIGWQWGGNWTSPIDYQHFDHS